MASSFLDNLKKAVETGEFNSEAANKINEIEQLAKIKASGKSIQDLEKNVDDRLKQAGTRTVNEKDAIESNITFETKMLELKKEEAENLKIAERENEIYNDIKSLDEFNISIEAYLSDLFDFIEFLETNYKDDDPTCSKLLSRIKELRTKYGSLLNRSI